MATEDLSGVIATVNLYALAVDTRRWELFDRAFTNDIEADFGGGALWRDLASFKRDFDAIHSPFAATQHVTTNHNVTIQGDTAHCLSYVHGRFIRQVDGGNFFESTGWYDDRLVRANDGWRIAKRVCRMVWANGNPRVLQTSDAVPVEHTFDALHVEAQAGRLAYLQALNAAR